MTIKTWIASAMGVFAGWLGVLLLMSLLSDAAPGAIVLWPAQDLVDHLPPGLAVTGAGLWWLAVAGNVDQMGWQLYSAGATLVLPAGLPGCLPLPQGG